MPKAKTPTKATKKVAVKKAAPKKVAKKAVAKVVVAKVEPKTKRPEITSKELVADFLTGKSFANSRIAFRQFKQENSTVSIKQAYFYTLFATFGTRTKKKDGIISMISTGSHKNCMAAYKAYKETVVVGEKAVAFTYFLNLWKKHFNLSGPIRQKAPKKEKVAKVSKTVELSTLSAKAVIAKATELLKEKANALPTNLKNKTAIVKQATELFKAEGYVVA